MAAKKEKQLATEIRDFQGVVLQADAFDLAPGSMQDQVNIKSDEKGRATVRWGCKTVTFDSSTTV